MYHKPTKIRSKKIRESAQGEQCTLRISAMCQGSSTTVFCHAPSRLKGTGTKSDDFWGAYGCSACHSMADSGHASAEDWMRAIYETQKRLFDKGLIEVT